LSSTIVVTGPIGATLASMVAPLPRQAMIDLSGFDPQTHAIFIATFHPETASEMTARDILATIQAIIAHAAAVPATRFLFTASNLDPGGETINAGLKVLQKTHPEQMRCVPSIGRDYWAALQTVAGVIGNSSSGILESSALGVPTLNIGERQAGRDRYGTVIELPWNAALITEAIVKVVEEWQQPTRRRHEGQATAARPWSVIASHLATFNLANAKTKRFVNLPS
jgi:UDP-N-acetylglucosamine 2-epimerase